MKNELKEVCKACPFRRASLPGYLGADNVEGFMESTMADHEMPCHLTVDYTDPGWFEKLDDAQACAGAAIFFRNICKESRDPSRLRLPADRDEVFSNRAEFMEHHKESRTLEDREAALQPSAVEKLASDDGPIEATRQERGGVWDIRHPGGDFQFAGDRNEVRAVLRRIQKNEEPYVRGIG